MSRSRTSAPSLPAEPDLPETFATLEEAPPDLRALELGGRLLRGLDLSGRPGHDLRVVESRLEDASTGEACTVPVDEIEPVSPRDAPPLRGV